MALNAINDLELLQELEQRSFIRQRIFRDRTNPFDCLDNEDFREKYRFSKETTNYIIQLIETDEKVTENTKRNRSLTVPF